ncbi:MAG: hypothetical protein COV70_02730 [Parcubacteria group bacterium CG11_big_fil_rev_8_21_14_0_20_39_22]|nr:MAG: hypothetical protein COV70_02730 [Parcubacteria group bacterium CG11_big_fil_rev_8_21_14_0_20_39_22]
MNNYYKNLPRKYMGSGALFSDTDGKILVVKPTYKDHWEIPGGVVEQNESPLFTCLREVKEELNITISGVRLLLVD